VSAAVSGSAEAFAQPEKRFPDVAIIDLSLDGEDGLELIVRLHQRRVPVLVYSMHSDAQRVAGAFASGAFGYVTKRERQEVLIQGIREVASGRRFVSPIAAAAVAEVLTDSPAHGGVEKLSPHERKVYNLLGEGADTFQIAAALNISNHTVESYYSRILVKLGLHSMRDLRHHAIAHLRKQTT
jgi:DNA-binding NarL/FixJ family response regulator